MVADTVVGAATRRLREGTKGTNVAGVVLMCASALVGIFFILVSVVFYLDNRGLAAHGARTQGQVVYADAETRTRSSSRWTARTTKTIFQTPSSGRMIIVTRRLMAVRASCPPTSALDRSTLTM